MRAAAALCLWCCAATLAQESTDPLRTDSRSPYVHRITLYDADGQAIDPRAEDARPYSPRATCTKCHEYGVIAHGWHFNAATGQAAAGRRGEPWILSDAQLRVQLPISSRGWPGAARPQDAGLNAWQFLAAFGRYLPGGGVGEPAARRSDASADSPRWVISGNLEVDCLSCHAAGREYDLAEYARQIERQNYQWAPTAAAALAVVRGEAAKLPDDFDPQAPPSPDFPERTPPRSVYDVSRFDADDRVFLDIVRDTPPVRCQACHSSQFVGETAPPRWQQADDVHLLAGMSCTDCHRHGIEHDLARGYPEEHLDTGQSWRAALSCAGCHLGSDSATATDPTLALGGAPPAPRPQHAGIPPLHFERLSCTACHSGPWPQDEPLLVQTAPAHALGLTSRTRAAGTLPLIAEPIFARDDAERITPHRALWPAWWGYESGGAARPIPLDVAKKQLSRVLPKPKHADDPASPLADEQILAALAALQSKAPADARVVYVRDGEVYRAEGDRLTRTRASVADPYLWPVAHNVRSASRSLGVRGCTDCHAEGAAIFFGSTAASQPAGASATMRQSDFHGYSPTLAGAWVRMFAGHTAFKVFGFAALGLLALILLRFVVGAPERRP